MLLYIHGVIKVKGNKAKPPRAINQTKSKNKRLKLTIEM
jgi:hypothetical protein